MSAMETVIGTDGINLRTELRPGDLGFIAHMHGLLYSEECGYGLQFEHYVLAGLLEFAQQYDSSKDRMWICEHEGKTIGCVIGLRREQGLVQLRYFLLLPAYRGIGLGKRLMDEFIAYMKEKDYRRAYLWTTDEQHAAISLYVRYGFTLTEEKSSAAFGKLLMERRYVLILPDGS